MLTSDTITDEQIRRLRKELRQIAKLRPLAPMDRAEAVADADTCDVALTDPRAMAMQIDSVRAGVRAARARCAEILNARAKGGV